MPKKSTQNPRGNPRRFGIRFVIRFVTGNPPRFVGPGHPGIQPWEKKYSFLKFGLIKTNIGTDKLPRMELKEENLKKKKT